MKTKYFKTTMIKALSFFIGALVVFSSCSETDYEDTIFKSKDEVLVLDGLYLKGEGTALKELQSSGRLKTTKNEVLQEVRSSLYEMYIAVKAGNGGFNLVTVNGSEIKTWGPASDFTEIPVGDRNGDEPQSGSLQRGGITETNTPFTVPEDGLYHFVYDSEIGVVALAQVNWGLIGNATPGGWSGDTELSMQGFDLNSITFEATDVEMVKGEFKLRYSGGWKLFLDEDYDLGEGNAGITVNTNYGGSVDALETGGSNIVWEDNGIYTVTFTWTLGKEPSLNLEKTGDLEVSYPEALYMIGDGLNMDDSDQDGTPDGWQWNLTDAPMVPVHSNPQLFWKIVWLESGGNVKFAPVQEWNGDFGMGEDLGNGEFTKGSNNIPVPGESGYYMVVVDLDEEKISITEPEVYLIGNVIGNVWDAATPEGQFTVDNANEVLTFEGALNAGELRMHAWHPYFEGVAEWWHVEFIILNDVIEFRGTGNDQERVNLDAGTYKIDLNFRNNTGSITQL